ncbi:hypothetical protein D3C86_1989610 [compost metagenome]
MFAIGQQDVAQVNTIFQAAHGQFAFAAVVDAKVQHETLLQQFGAHHFHPGQVHFGVRLIAAEPGRTTAEPENQGCRQQIKCDSPGDHGRGSP